MLIFPSTLVQKDQPEGFQSFIDGSGIRHEVFNMIGTKKADIPVAMMQSILRLVVDKRNYPLLIHCNHGKHRTGCVVGVLRKFNGWDTPSILAEYTKYAEPKIRETDVKYLTDFKLSNLRRMVARKLEDQPLSIGSFLLLTLVAGFSLCIWVLSLKFGICVPRPPPRRDES
jgi:tyrosine-protein phosphatase SIW14